MIGSRKNDPWLFASLRGYQPSWLVSDAIAALTLAAIAIPEQLATARLVGLPPMAGLLAFGAGTLAFAAFGANRFISVGADSTIAPIMASALAAIAIAGSAAYAGMAAALALLVGAVLLIAGIARAGWIADLLSIPVTTGFLAGISVHIIVGQMPDLLGLAAPSGDIVHRLIAIVRQLPRAKLDPTLIGVGVLVVALLADRINKRIPGAFIGFLVSGLAVWSLGLAQRGTAVLGALPIARLHPIIELPSWQQFTQLLPTSLIVALVCMMQTAAVVRSFPNDPKTQENVSRDFAAIGAGSILAAILGAFAVDSSPPRTAVVHESGGKSQIAGLLAIAIAATIALLAANAFAVLPVAALSGVLVFIGMRIFRVATMLQIYRRGGYEILLVAAGAALVVLLPIQTGVTMSILLSLVHSVYIIARPDCVVMSRVPGTTVWWDEPAGETGERETGVLVFAPGAPVYFTNAAYIRRKLMDAITAMDATAAEPCRLVVLEAHGVIDIDYSGSLMLQQAFAELYQRGIKVALARLESDRAQRAAKRTGLIGVLGSENVFRSVEDAIRARSSHGPASRTAGS
ncbi:MAG: SulP family inorganic anion transporter [Xanthobacteraceae bacterium]